jgi:pimeloyl-ACP methyl ester carboxylesterase
MYESLFTRLADTFHLVAPDYPGFGQSDAPDPTAFDYTFDNLARIIERFTELMRIDRYSLFLEDYSGPVGFRVAAARPGSTGRATDPERGRSRGRLGATLANSLPICYRRDSDDRVQGFRPSAGRRR